MRVVRTVKVIDYHLIIGQPEFDVIRVNLLARADELNRFTDAQQTLPEERVKYQDELYTINEVLAAMNQPEEKL